MNPYSTTLYIAYFIDFIYLALAVGILFLLFTYVKKCCRFVYIANRVTEDQYQKIIENQKNQKKVT